MEEIESYGEVFNAVVRVFNSGSPKLLYPYLDHHDKRSITQPALLGDVLVMPNQIVSIETINRRSSSMRNDRMAGRWETNNHHKRFGLRLSLANRDYIVIAPNKLEFSSAAFLMNTDELKADLKQAMNSLRDPHSFDGRERKAIIDVLVEQATCNEVNLRAEVMKVMLLDALYADGKHPPLCESLEDSHTNFSPAHFSVMVGSLSDNPR